jgi:hypothetical protein
MRSALFWAVTQHVVGIPYRRFGTTYRSYLQESRGNVIDLSVHLGMADCLCLGKFIDMSGQQNVADGLVRSLASEGKGWEFVSVR